VSTDDPWTAPRPDLHKQQGRQGEQAPAGQAPAYGGAPQDGQAPAYGGAPQYGQAPTGPPTRPSTVTNAVRLMYVGAALSLLSGVLTVTLQDQMRAEFDRQAAAQGGSAQVPEGFVDSMFGAVVVVSIVLGVIFAGLWIMNAVACSRGRNWGRITGTVLGGLFLLFFLASLLQPTVGAAMAVSIITALVVVATVVLLWLRPSNEFFAAAGAARRAGR